MTKTVVAFTCAHSKDGVSNERATWLGNLLYDVRPDYVVDLGDTIDLPSLSTYEDRYPKAVVAQNYEKDLEAYHDFQTRIRERFKKSKRKRPAFFGFEGNHEYRIKKALAFDPRLEGDRYGISFSHLETNRYYDEYYEYLHSAPQIAHIDGIAYAHYFTSGNMGRAMASEHHAYNLVKKLGCSATCGHTHKRSFFPKDDTYPRPTLGLVAGCFKGKEEHWAGQSNREWWKGVVIKRNLEDGVYDPEFVSMDRLEKEYGTS